jgi:hypothetical protein
MQVGVKPPYLSWPPASRTFPWFTLGLETMPKRLWPVMVTVVPAGPEVG